MQLPGRLAQTTLGDLLGRLHRAGVSGTLELVESTGRTHRVHLTRGNVAAVELDRANASLAELLRRDDAVSEDVLRRSLLRAIASRRLHGEVLVHDFCLAPEVVSRALRRQLLLRLSTLDQLGDAEVRFRVTMRPPRGALTDSPLGANDFLSGKRRARDRMHSASFVEGGSSTSRDRALRALGLGRNAAPDEVRKAYRARVRAYHPDLHPGASAEEQRRLGVLLTEVTEAYKALVA